MGKFAKKIEELEQAIDMDKAFVCKDLLEELDKEADDPEIQTFYKLYSKKIALVRKDNAYLIELLDQLNSNDGWVKAVSHRDGTQVHYRFPEDSEMLMTKLEALIPCEVDELADTFIKLLSLFSETTLIPKWFPFSVMKSNETLEKPTSFTRLTHIKLKLPFPVSLVFGPRDCVIRGKGYDISEERAVAISVSTLKAGSVVQGLTVPESAEGFTPFEFRGAYYLELTREGIMFKQLQLIDLNTNVIPPMVMNWIAKGELPLRQLKQIKAKLKKFEGSVWEEKVAEDNDKVYKDVHERLEKVIERDFLKES